MRKFLFAEVAVLLSLLIVATIVRIGIESYHAQLAGTTNPPQTQESTQSTQDIAVMGTEGTQPMESIEQTQPTTLELNLKAQQYFVYDVQQDKYLAMAGTTDERVYPASITKLFTAYVALQYLKPKETITVDWDVHKDPNQGGILSKGSSLAQIDWGDKLTTEMLVEAMLLPSGNDAAYILAVKVGRMITGNKSLHYSDAAIAFVEEMNRIAQELGLTGTHFANPDGIHRETHYSTYADLATIAQLVLENETIMKYTRINVDYVTFASGEERTWKNTNELINPDSEFYCPYAVGLKTGQTPKAGSCLLSAFQYEDRTLIVGVFGCPQVADRFNDTLQIFYKAAGLAGIEAG